MIATVFVSNHTHSVTAVTPKNFHAQGFLIFRLKGRLALGLVAGCVQRRGCPSAALKSSPNARPIASPSPHSNPF